MIVRCPQCQRETSFKDNPFRPFCSQRCKLIDLGKWASEAYRVPTRTQDEEEDGLPDTSKDAADP